MLPRCGECGCVLREWEEAFLWEYPGGGEYVCEDCFDSLALSLSRRELAERLGCQMLRGGEG